MPEVQGISAPREHLFIKAIYYSALVALCVLLAYALWVLLIPLLVGFLLAFLSEPVVQSLERRGIQRGVAAGMLYLFVGVALTLALKWAVPLLHSQWVQFQSHQAEYAELVERNVEQLRVTATRFLPESTVLQLETDARASLVASWSALQDSIPDIALSVLGALGTGMFIPIIAILFLLAGEDVKKYFIAMLPNRYFEMSLMMLHKVNTQLGGYVRGQFMDCLIIGSMHGVGLLLLDVKGALFLALFAGLANAVPYAGPVMGAIPAMLILFLDPAASSPWWSVPILFLFVNLLDNVAVYPLTVGKSLQLTPFAVILGILFGGIVAGIPGMIITVPLMGMARQIFQVLHSSLKSYRII